jgi:hypothetical protein
MTNSDKPDNPFADAATQSTATLSEIMMAGSPGIARIWSGLACEGTRFLCERLQEDLKTQAALLSCKTPAELSKLQTDYVQTAMAHYGSTAQCIIRVMAKATEEATALSRTDRSRDYDDVPV